jgi:hypothetical protein
MDSKPARMWWHGATWFSWNLYAVCCCLWFLRSVSTRDWIEMSFALLAVAGCALESRAYKVRYDRAGRSTYMDEPPLQTAVSALTQPWVAAQESTAGEWAIDTHDTDGNPMHACSRGEGCTHLLTRP